MSLPKMMPEFLEGMGYEQPRKVPSGEWIAFTRFLFTWGLVIGLDDVGYRCRWCYATRAEAMAALESWDGVGDDPPGRWIKQKGRASTGKVVDRSRATVSEDSANA